MVWMPDLKGDLARMQASAKKKKNPLDELVPPKLEELTSVGDYAPELMQESAVANIQEDPRLRDAQLGALEDLQGTVDADGLDARTLADLNKVQGQVASAERGSREAILANQRARGLGGSGAELAALLSNQQGSAQRANQAGLETAAIGQDRKAAALRDLANLGGNIRGQDFNQNLSKAEAYDKIKGFNTGLRNDAQKMNLENKQRISDTNKLGVEQQNWDNTFNVANAKNQQQMQKKQLSAQQKQADRDFVSGLAGSALTAAAMASDKNVKTDVKPFDVDAFLDNVTGYKYRYKEPEKYGEGEQIGVMAQDVEKALPQAVSEDQEGVKRIDYSKVGAPILAALAEMNKKIKELEESDA